MSDDEYLKLTAYFGERQRSGGRFVSDALLDLFGAESVATSVVLRGIAGFGPRHDLRTDLSLSMSEDPPIAIAAVDTAAKIAALADRAVDAIPRGLLTLERARVILDSVTAAWSPDRPGATVKLTVYVGRRQQITARPAYLTVCDTLHRLGFACATVFLGVDGTANGQRHRARFLRRNVDVPVMIVAVGTADQALLAIPELDTLPGRQLVTIERAQLCKQAGRLLTRPATVPATDAAGRPLYQKLMIHTSEADMYDGAPIHRAVVNRLRGVPSMSGVTVLRGIWGFAGAGQPRGDRLIQLGRRVPVTTVVVDTPERIAAAFDIVDELTGRHGVISSELVPAMVSIDSGSRLGDTRIARYPTTEG